MDLFIRGARSLSGERIDIAIADGRITACTWS